MLDPSSHPPGRVALRPVEPSDRDFLLRLYGSTREAELAQVDWTPEEKEAFVRMQFEAQDRYYRECYSGAEFYVVTIDEMPAGRLYWQWRTDELRIIDITLAPDYRNQGHGTGLLQNLIEQAALRQLPVRIHVEPFNPARRLYERLGFHLVRQVGLYMLLEWAGTPD